jgi:hypothetical protein
MREKEARAVHPQGQSSSSSQVPESASTCSSHAITNGIQNAQYSIDPAVDQLCTELGKRKAACAMVNNDLGLNSGKVDQLINVLIVSNMREFAFSTSKSIVF